MAELEVGQICELKPNTARFGRFDLSGHSICRIIGVADKEKRPYTHRVATPDDNEDLVHFSEVRALSDDEVALALLAW